MNIVNILQQQAFCRPTQAAIIDGPERHPRVMTFAQLEQDASRFAALLKKQGLQAGDSALIFQTMSVELYVILLALFRIGMVAMFVDPSQGRTYLERCCQRVPPTLLIASSKAHLLRVVSPALRRIPHKVAIGMRVPGTIPYLRLQHEQADPTIMSCEADTPALMTFTSGSTGLPKAAVRSHGFLLAQHKVLAANLKHQPGEVDLVTLPIFVLANLASGITSRIPDVDLRQPGSINAATIAEHIHAAPQIRTAASPAFYQRLAEYAQQQQVQMPNLQRIDTGGAPVFPGLLATLQKIAPAADVVAVYGSTEAEPIAHHHWCDVSENDLENMRTGKGLLAGKPVAEIECRIIHDRFGTAIGPFTAVDFASICRDANVAGEIVVAGEHVLPGYLDGQGDEETKFRVDGRPWHRTGDTGYFDDKGRLWLLGRSMARICDDKGELHPFAVETVAHSDTRIRRAAMVSVNSLRMLVIEPHPGQTVDLKALHTKLSWAKLDTIKLLPRIPVDKRHNAKIDYPSLYKLLNGLF
jgi:olefin beta-lactone synthetase